jgi:hypothetical protein
MPKQSSGRYDSKHPSGSAVAPRLHRALQSAAVAGRLSCSRIHTLSRELGVSPQEAGKAADLGNIRISKCQLGLFSHAPSAPTDLTGLQQIDATLESAVRGALENGRLPCAVAWRLAKTHAVTRREMGQYTQKMAIKISTCQLGAF